MDKLDNLMSNFVEIDIFTSISYTFLSLDEVGNNVSAATENVNKILSYSNQLKVQLSKPQELYSRETSVALKQTAENVIHMISNNAKEVADKNIDAASFEEFVSSFFKDFFLYLAIILFRNVMLKNESLCRKMSYQ